MSALSNEYIKGQKNIDDWYCEQSHLYLLKSRFKIGKGADIDKSYYMETLNRINNRCYMSDCLKNSNVEEKLNMIL